MQALGINTIKELIDTIALLAGVAAIFWGIRTYNVTRSQFSFSVMTSCIERFQAIIADMTSPDPDTRLQAVRKYVDLCNEEIFYFRNGYLPDEVRDEWLEGMMVFLPWLDSKNTNLNPNAIPEILDQDLLRNYPRVRATLHVSRSYNIDIAGERIKLLEQVKTNLKRNPHQIS